jgi:predicted RNA-binding protein YlxR (DUF448 family)
LNKKTEILRQCAGCGSRFPKSSLIRIVLTPEKKVEIDLKGRLNGRGTYICMNASCLKKARENKGLERAMHYPVDGEIYRMLEQDLMKAVDENGNGKTG